MCLVMLVSIFAYYSTCIYLYVSIPQLHLRQWDVASVGLFSNILFSDISMEKLGRIVSWNQRLIGYIFSLMIEKKSTHILTVIAGEMIKLNTQNHILHKI